MKIEQRRRRAWTHGRGILALDILADIERNLAGATTSGAVLTLDFHLEDLVGLVPAVDLGVSEQGDHAFLKGAETAFDLAFGLRSWGHEVSDTQSP